VFSRASIAGWPTSGGVAALGVIEGLPIGSVVAGNRHNLLDGTAGLGQGLGCVLAQAVRGKFLGSPDTL
jgi:hypothetical protein